MNRFNRWHYRVFMVALLFFVVLISFFVYWCFAPSIISSQGVIYYVPPGASRQSIITEAARSHIFLHPFLFTVYANFHPHVLLKSGEYFFAPKASLAQVFRQLSSGTGLVYYAITIVPGWSFSQLKHALHQSNALKHTIQFLGDQDLMQRLDCAMQLPSPEGAFFPDTYYYTRDTTDQNILHQACFKMQRTLEHAWQTKDNALPYHSPYEALIVASLIEKEAHIKTEQPIIAGVFVNRLHHHMLLQSDPTVIYGLADRYQGKLDKKQLEKETPYNTYKHKGLPPTPIAVPSLGAIDAALHPMQHRYFYFVARGDGAHYFSMTLKEHHLAVTLFKYRQSLLRIPPSHLFDRPSIVAKG